MNDRLRLLSGNELLALRPTDGQETLGQATEVFRYIDRNFEHWKCNTAGLPTEATVVQVYEMVRDSTLQEMFGSFGIPIDFLALTQAQIKQFTMRYPNWLKKGGNGTFFVLKDGGDFFVSAVYLFSDCRIGVRLRGLTLERVFRAQKRHRVVVKSR